MTWRINPHPDPLPYTVREGKNNIILCSCGFSMTKIEQ